MNSVQPHFPLRDLHDILNWQDTSKSGGKMEEVGKVGTGNLIGDITDEEIQQWKNSSVSDGTGAYFAGLAAESIRKGTYSPGQEVYGMTDRNFLCNWADGMSPKAFDNAMNMLVERNMVRFIKRRSAWDWVKIYYVVGGANES